MKRQALRCVLSEKARKDRLVCLDSMSTIDGKTKSMAQLLENLAIGGSALVVTKGTDRSVVTAANNLTKIWTLPVHQLNALDLLSRDMVIMTVEAARWMEETLASEPHGRRGAKWTALSDGVAVAEPVIEEASEPVADAAAEIATEETTVEATKEATPRPRRRRAAAATTETAAPDADAAEEAPKPRRRRTAAAKPDATAEAPAEEDAPKPRTRRRRTTATAADESAPEAEATETQETPPETPDEAA